MKCKYGPNSKVWVILGCFFIWMLVLYIPFANAQLQVSIPTGLTAFPEQIGLEVPVEIDNLAYLDTLGVGVGIAYISVEIKYDNTVLKATGSSKGPIFPTTDWVLADNADDPIAPDVIKIVLNDEDPRSKELTSISAPGVIVNAIFDVITDDPTLASRLDFELLDVAAYDQGGNPIPFVDVQGTSGNVDIEALKLSFPTGLYSPPWSGTGDYPVVKIPINIGNLEYLAYLESQGIQGIAGIKVAISYDPLVLDATGAEAGPQLPADWDIQSNADYGPDTIMIIADQPDPTKLITSGSDEGIILYAVFDVISTNPQDCSILEFGAPEVGALDPDGHAVAVITETTSGDICLPVEHSALGAIQSVSEGIKIFWEAVSQQGNLGWNIYRSRTKDGKFTKINGELVAGAGTTSDPMKYSFADKEVEKGKVYYYYLEDISFNGERHRTPLIRTSLVNKFTSWGDIKRSALH